MATSSPPLFDTDEEEERKEAENTEGQKLIADDDGSDSEIEPITWEKNYDEDEEEDEDNDEEEEDGEETEVGEEPEEPFSVNSTDIQIGFEVLIGFLNEEKISLRSFVAETVAKMMSKGNVASTRR